MKYRKKPIVIEAFQLPALDEGPSDALLAFLEKSDRVMSSERDGCLLIQTLEGDHFAEPGDWIICGGAGEYYPCKPDIFEATYELVE